MVTGQTTEQGTDDELLAVKSDAIRLVQFLQGYPRLVVAFSGGVDSSVVLAAAVRAKLDRLIAVTAKSESVAGWQSKLASQIAGELNVEHWIADTDELSRAEYQRNDSQRCYFCKQTLYESIARELNQRLGRETGKDSNRSNFSIASGTNHDDLGDHRPGIQAGTSKGVITPLASIGLGKQRVRALAEHWGLGNHDLPASPCLASRIAYGVSVTKERLWRVEQAENWLYSQGFREFRVRLHAGELARIEVPKTEQMKPFNLDADGEMSDYFRQIGFQFVTIDTQGFQSGSLNRQVIPIGIRRNIPLD